MRKLIVLALAFSLVAGSALIFTRELSLRYPVQTGLEAGLAASGATAERTISVGSCDSLVLSCRVNLRIRTGNAASLTLRGRASSIKGIRAEMHGTGLEIEPESLSTFLGGDTVDGDLVVAGLSRIQIKGAGEIVFADPFKAHELELTIDGSGSIGGPVSVERLEATINGLGEIRLSGRAEECRIELLGAGNCRAPDLGGNSAMVRIVGAGSAEIGSFAQLDADLIGAGEIGYRGNPRITSKKTGAGELRKRD